MLRQTKAPLALWRVRLEQAALDQGAQRIGGVPVAHAEHGFEVATRHFFTAQKQLVQAAQGLLAYALFYALWPQIRPRLAQFQ